MGAEEGKTVDFTYEAFLDGEQLQDDHQVTSNTTLNIRIVHKPVHEPMVHHERSVQKIQKIMYKFFEKDEKKRWFPKEGTWLELKNELVRKDNANAANRIIEGMRFKEQWSIDLANKIAENAGGASKYTAAFSAGPHVGTSIVDDTFITFEDSLLINSERPSPKTHPYSPTLHGGTEEQRINEVVEKASNVPTSAGRALILNWADCSDSEEDPVDDIPPISCS